MYFLVVSIVVATKLAYPVILASSVQLKIKPTQYVFNIFCNYIL